MVWRLYLSAVAVLALGACEPQLPSCQSDCHYTTSGGILTGATDSQ